MGYMIAAVIEPGPSIVAANPVDGVVLHRFFQGLPAAGLGLSQPGFELTPRLPNERKVGRIGRQEQQLDASSGDGWDKA